MDDNQQEITNLKQEIERLKQIIQDLEIAKEMEKEQTLKFGIKCQLDFIKSDGIKAVDDIYEQTYGGNK